MQKARFYPPKMKKFNIGLVGFGVVGQGFYELLKESTLPLVVQRICVRDRRKARTAPRALFTDNPFDLLDDPEIDLIVEAISETEPAYAIVSEALRRGLPVASASKKMLALHISELLDLQAAVGYRLRYEAAVAGAIPIISLLEESLGHDKVLSLEAVLNGTSNYILTRMRRDRLTYQDALRLAQQAGFAEADPWLDVSGWDAAYKLSLLALHAFGKPIEPESIRPLGIDSLSEAVVQGAGRLGQRYRLVASLGAGPAGSLQAAVRPAPLGPEHSLFGVEEELNGLQLNLAAGGPQAFTGRGAGARATASALLADVLKLKEGRGYRYAKREKLSCKA
jgi:homoserine dehydrogenase